MRRMRDKVVDLGLKEGVVWYMYIFSHDRL